MKFLLQKVSQIPQAANLYKQTGTAWGIFGVTLFDLCVTAIREEKVNEAEVKKHLDKATKDTKMLNEDCCEKEFFTLMHDAFLGLCEDYVDILNDKYGQVTKTDKLSRKRLSTFSPEHFEELLAKLEGKSRLDIERESIEGISDNDQNGNEQKGDDIDVENSKILEAEQIIAENATNNSAPDDVVEEETETKFKFSDFANQGPGLDSPMMSESGDSDAEMEKAKSSITEFAKEVQDRKEAKDEKVEIEEEIVTEEKSEHKERTEGDGVDVRAATPSDSQAIMAQYRNRKTLHKMPPKSTRKNPFIERHQTSMSRQKVDPEIEQQREKSLIKDSEAQMSVWNELVCLMLHLLASLKDEEFKVCNSYQPINKGHNKNYV